MRLETLRTANASPSGVPACTDSGTVAVQRTRPSRMRRLELTVVAEVRARDGPGVGEPKATSVGPLSRYTAAGRSIADPGVGDTLRRRPDLCLNRPVRRPSFRPDAAADELTVENDQEEALSLGRDLLHQVARRRLYQRPSRARAVYLNPLRRHASVRAERVDQLHQWSRERCVLLNGSLVCDDSMAAATGGQRKRPRDKDGRAGQHLHVTKDTTPRSHSSLSFRDSSGPDR